MMQPKKKPVSRMKALKIITLFSLIVLIGLNLIGLRIDHPPAAVTYRLEADFHQKVYSDHSNSIRAASVVGYVLSIRGIGAANRSLAIMGAMRHTFPVIPCSIFIDAAAFDELQQQFVRRQPWCNLELLTNQYDSDESPFVRTALDFADAAFREQHFTSTIWINSEFLPSCAQLNESIMQLTRASTKVKSRVEFIIPEVALNLADTSWSSVPTFGISVSKASEETRLAVFDFANNFIALTRTHGTRKVFPLRSVMLLFWEAALRTQLKFELKHHEVAIHLRRFTQAQHTQEKNSSYTLGSIWISDHEWFEKNSETLNTCARLQTLGRSVALRMNPHATDAITLPVLESALETNASFRPTGKCSFKDCYTTKHPWESEFSRVGQVNPLTAAERQAIDDIYAPPSVSNQKSPSVAIITLLGVGELVVQCDSRSYMVRVKQLFSELSNGHISFHLYFAHELVCGDDEKTWTDIESMSYGWDGPNRQIMIY